MRKAYDFSIAKRAKEVPHLAKLQAEIGMSSMTKIRSPGKRPKKQKMTARYFDPEVLNAFRSTGKGWQTRMNDALKEWLSEHAV